MRMILKRKRLPDTKAARKGARQLAAADRDLYIWQASKPGERVHPNDGRMRATTIVAVRHNGRVALAGDGQVTLGDTVMKASATKVRKLKDGKIVAGFAGSVA